MEDAADLAGTADAVEMLTGLNSPVFVVVFGVGIAVAIYGWLRRDGATIQLLSTGHMAWYADYCHGIRLVSDTVFVDGQARSVFDLTGAG